LKTWKQVSKRTLANIYNFQLPARWEDHFQPVWVKSVAAVSCKCKVFHLIQNVRAKDSPELLDLTTTIRNGKITSVEISTLAARNLQTLPDAEKVEFASGVTIVDTQAKRVHGMHVL
jgi:hypothetical protein